MTRGFAFCLLAAFAIAQTPAPSSAQMATPLQDANGRVARDCVEMITQDGRAYLQNQCGAEVEIFWCYDDGECADDGGNGGTLGDEKLIAVEPNRKVYWSACFGANTLSVREHSNGKQFTCSSTPYTLPEGGAEPERIGTDGSGGSSGSGSSGGSSDSGSSDEGTSGAAVDTIDMFGATQAKLLTPMDELITGDDYPVTSLRAGEQGAVVYSVVISKSGAPESCEIAQSSGFAALDNKTCELVMGRARFEPARDGDGDPVRTRVSQKIRWTLPE